MEIESIEEDKWVVGRKRKKGKVDNCLLEFN